MATLRPLKTLAAASLFPALISGCIPIAPAHKFVDVPALDVEIRTAGEPITAAMEAIQPEFWSAAKTFVDIVKDLPTAQRFQRESRSFAPGMSGIANISFTDDKRYVAVPAISIIPEHPDTGRHHVVFLRVASEDELHRVSIDRNKARVETTSISAAHKLMPPVLHEPEPKADAMDKKWVAWFRAQNNFYSAVDWKASSRVKILGLSRTSARDSVTVELTRANDG